MHLMKGYQAEPILKHSGTTTKKSLKNNPSEGEARRLLSVRDRSVVEARPHRAAVSTWLATMTQLFATNHWSPYQKQGNPVPQRSLLLYWVMRRPWNGGMMDSCPTVAEGQVSTSYFLSVREISIIKTASCQ